MKVQICETITTDVETEVDVNINDILNEFSRRIETAEMNSELPCKSVFLPLVDFATRLMARIPADGIAKCKDIARVEVAKRLRDEAERWAATYDESEET